MTRLTATVLLLALAAAAPVSAQGGGYVSASLVGDVARFDQYDSIGQSDSGNGEALGFALRVGSALRARWGVELEFVRPGEIRSEVTPEVFPLLTPTTISPGPSLPGLPDVSVYDPLLFPSFSYSFRTRQRNTTLATTVWIGQRVSSKFSLSYLGGIAFGRTTREIEVTYQPIRFPIVPIPPSVVESTTYDVSPVVGIEGSIVLTEHVQLIPGVRLHGIDGGWLLRPAIGIGWVF